MIKIERAEGICSFVFETNNSPTKFCFLRKWITDYSTIMYKINQIYPEVWS